VGFGPANEVHAHTPEDQCPVEHLTKAARFYATFPGIWAEMSPGTK
jgi:acetylornithine deacetylase/succinyl-diaminopimelate desuccinylase-like protein